MDIQATFTSALRSTLKEVLSTINVQTELWHYCILLPESNSSSLANLLGLSLTELVIILRLCGLINDRGDSYHLKIEPTITIRGSYSLKELLNQAQLNDNYFDKKKVKNVTDSKLWWLGIGYSSSVYSPSTQFDLDVVNDGQPQLPESLKRKVKKYSFCMKNIVQLMQNETDATDKISLDLSGNIKEREAMSSSTKESQKFPSNHEEIRSLGFAISKCEDVFDMKKNVDRLIEIVLKHEFNEQLEKMKLILEKRRQ